MSKTHSYKRVLLKLSGEMLMQGQAFGVNPEACTRLAGSIKAIRDQGIEVGLVIGGGNIFRGVNLKEMGMERSPADQIGMLATLINGVSLQQALEKAGCRTHVLSALECPRVAETYTWRAAVKYLAAGDVIIFAGGTGNPYFTTDTAAALRASEIHADILLKATKVDGVYAKDPLKFRDAVRYPALSYSKMLTENLAVMDATAVALCRSSHIPILVFDMGLLHAGHAGNILNNIQKGTLISGD